TVSYKRLRFETVGNDVSAWGYGSPSPGIIEKDEDHDGDGLPDLWEVTHGLNPLDASDCMLDPDEDSHNTFEEFLSGTNPQDSEDFLTLAVHPVGNQILFTWMGEASSLPGTFTRIIAIEASPDGSGPWSIVAGPFPVQTS